MGGNCVSILHPYIAGEFCELGLPVEFYLVGSYSQFITAEIHNALHFEDILGEIEIDYTAAHLDVILLEGYSAVSPNFYQVGFRFNGSDVVAVIFDHHIAVQHVEAFFKIIILTVGFDHRLRSLTAKGKGITGDEGKNSQK